MTGQMPPASGDRPRDPAALERAMIEDDDAALVYADWLVEQGDPRGELAHVQHRLESRPEDPRLREAERRLLSEHHERLVGALATSSLRWRRGFIHAADVATLDELDALLAHPSARYLRELAVDLPFHTATHGILRLADSPLPSLRSLSLRQDYSGDDLEVVPAYSLAWGICEHEKADRLWTALPGLQRLALQGWDLFHSLNLPALAELTILEGAPFCAWGKDWDVPALERLRWTFTCDRTGTSVMFHSQHLDPLRESALPELRELDLSECLVGPGGDDDEAEHHWLLDDLPIIDRLEVLRLATYHFRGGESLVDRLTSRGWLLAHLRELGVRARDQDIGVNDEIAEQIREAIPSFTWL